MRRSRQKRRVVLEAVDRASVVERLRAGDRVVEIAAAFGVAERTVYLIGDEAALADRRRSHSGFRLTYQERVAIAGSS